jgi:hypothetical protein
MPSPRVTLIINGRRYAMRRTQRYYGDGPFTRAFRPTGSSSPAVVAELTAVHTYKCNQGRWDRRRKVWRDCDCGAAEMLKAFVKVRR